MILFLLHKCFNGSSDIDFVVKFMNETSPQSLCEMLFLFIGDLFYGVGKINGHSNISLDVSCYVLFVLRCCCAFIWRVFQITL